MLNLTITDERLEGAVRFHGHLCPGLLIGYRAALLALVRLGIGRAQDEELAAIVENDSCSVDAIQYLTGCTFGKGNLIYRNYGKQAFTLIRRTDNRGVRLAFTGDRFRIPGPDGRVDREAFGRALIEAGDDELFSIREEIQEPPRVARIFPTLPCDGCGEGVMEPRLFTVDGRKLCFECLRKTDLAQPMTHLADFLFEVGMLKKTKRTGYAYLGNGHESVAEHSFRVAVIAWMLARMTPGVDENKALRLALFHDLPEARTGDHNYVAKRYVTVDETAAAHDAAQNAPNGPEIEALVIEFNEGQSEEARIAYDADQLDMMVELKEKKDLGNPYAGAWLHYARKRLRTTGGLALADAVMATDWTHWWFRREDHLWVLNHDE